MIKIIGAGLGRTGTKSLQEALIQLGFNKCYHMGELFLNPHGVQYWKEASRKGDTEWNDLFAGYQAIVDFPGAMFYKELVTQYPDAKIILTERDPETWYESAKRTVYVFKPSLKSMLRLLVNAPFNSVARNIIRVGKFNEKAIWGDFFEGKFEDKEFAISKFVAHNEEVKKSIPSDKLLVFQSAQGWGPICDFLNLPIPEMPYPTSNSRQSFYEWADGLIHRSLNK